MSFFHEPPPLDCDIPPPLDDKLRENDFDLEEEEIIIEDNRIDLPELPTDFNVFCSSVTDPSLYIHQPPEFSSFALSSSTPPLDIENECDKNESPGACDVAKEKESFKIDEALSLSQNQLLDKENVDLKEISNLSRNEDENKENVGYPEQIGDNNIEEPSIPAVDTVVDSIDHNVVEEVNEIPEFPPLDITVVNNQVFDELPDLKISNLEPEPEADEEDDEFNDFVEASATDDKFESFVAFKPEAAIGDPEETEMFSEFSSHIKDIPEPIPELNLDDDDDDFNDFETAIPVNRQIEQVEPITEVEFVADFSSFNAFSEPTDDNSFEEFQDFKVSGFDNVKDSHAQLALDDDEDDDDDFGDFNDFTQAPVATVEPQMFTFVKPANVDGVLDMMFPPTSSSCSAEAPQSSDFAKEHLPIKSDIFVNKFNDFDSTVALGYLYSNSKASQILVKALGIDTRNILLGPQWSSSTTSSMPRFAANLSLNPIEPIKPTVSQSSTSAPKEITHSILQPTKAPTDFVPEAEFDWNSSGLVNPLDGPQSKSKQSNEHEPIIIQQPTTEPPPAHSFQNESSLHGVDQEDKQILEAETKTISSHKSELSDVSAYQWSTEMGSQSQHPAASSNLVVRERTIKLPETHIFTPVKGTSPVAREVISREVSPSPDDPYFTKGPITVKEYHDVEYSLEPKRKSETEVDFDEFQSALPVSNPTLVPLPILEPLRIEKSVTEIKWPEPGNVVQPASSDLDFLGTAPPVLQKPNFNLPLAPPPTISLKKKEPAFSKPVIGTSPTEQNGTVEDDDFNDFQAAPAPSIPETKKMPSNDPITLSPARLAASVAADQSNQKSSWISSFDNDEVNRIEAAFPKCKPERKEAPKKDDDDDWTDFVGASQPPSSQSYLKSQAPSMISSNTMSNPTRLSNGDADDWSDFQAAPSVSKNSAVKSSQFQMKPNFSSWHQPIGKPYVNHTTSFLSNEPSSQNPQFSSNNYPFVIEKVPRHSMTIHNNFNYNPPNMYNGTTGSSGNHHQQQQTKPNGISTILPELDFAMPKNVISLPRGGQIDPGKK